MRQRFRQLSLLFLLLSAVGIFAASPAAQLRISGSNIQTLEITSADLTKMPRLAVDVREPHSGETQHYEGVRLSDLLAKAGVPLGEKLRGRGIATYILVQASDGYAVVFSIAEVDPALTDNRIILADTMNGKPLGEHDGPFKVVVPGEKRPARWVRMVNAMRVESAVGP
jgi:hypothetical protein